MRYRLNGHMGSNNAFKNWEKSHQKYALQYIPKVLLWNSAFYYVM